jgi:hypothetical protein
MLGCAATFERAALMKWEMGDTDYPHEIEAAQDAWSHLMAEGIFDMEMYGELPDDLSPHSGGHNA